MKILGKAIILRGNLWLTTIRDAFVVLMPLTFFGLTALVVQHLPLEIYRQVMNWLWGDGWPLHLERIIRASLGIFGMALSVVVSTLLSRRLIRPSLGDPEVPLLITSTSAAINFILLVSFNSSSLDSLGRVSMLHGIVAGIATAELFRVFLQSSLLQFNDAPHGSDSTYHQAMRYSPAVIAVGVTFFALSEILSAMPELSPYTVTLIADWTQALEGNAAWLMNTLAVILSQTAWFLGIHGANFLDAYGAALFSPIGTPYTNTLAWRPLFNHFALMGGAGATLSLVIAILISTRRGPQNHVAKWSIFPALLNINEAILYGLPIVLNVRYLLPFIGVPLLFILTALSAAELGWVTFLPVNLPWTTPPVVSGWLLTDSWRGAALQCAQIAVGVMIYRPFVRSAEAARKANEVQEVANALNTISESIQKSGKFLIHHDQTGFIARGLLSDLHRALNADDGALWLAFQPKHDISGRVLGVEALVRWTHEIHGPIPPMVVIALAENDQTIHTLGMWILKQACASKARWNEIGYRHLTMAINLSPLQLEGRTLTSKLDKLLRQHGLEASEIELEITESTAIPNTQAVEQTLQELADMGVRLAMDDFGMGYSSLLYLRRFHVHSIKVDGSLTRDVLTNNTNAEIIRTIASLGRSQRVDVVAEYVETQEQRVRLADLGCDIFQGYFHSPPLPEAQCIEYFRMHFVVQEGKDLAT